MFKGSPEGLPTEKKDITSIPKNKFRYLISTPLSNSITPSLSGNITIKKMSYQKLEPYQ